MSKPAIAENHCNDSDMAKAMGMVNGGNISGKLKGYGIEPKYRMILGQGASAKIVRLYTKRQRQRAVKMRQEETAKAQPSLFSRARIDKRARELKCGRFGVGAFIDGEVAA